MNHSEQGCYALHPELIPSHLAAKFAAKQSAHIVAGARSPVAAGEENAKSVDSLQNNDVFAHFGYMAVTHSSLHGLSNSALTWFVDSGASGHLCRNREWMTDFRPNSTTVTVGDGRSLAVTGSWTVRAVPSTNGPTVFVIHDVLCVPLSRPTYYQYLSWIIRGSMSHLETGG